MCKLLIHRRLISAHPSDEKINAGQFQPGHVISIIEDDQQFGSGDSGHATVIAYPGVPKSEMEFLLTPEIEETVAIGLTERNVTRHVRQVRMYKAKNINALLATHGTVGLKGQTLDFVNTHFDKVEKLVPKVGG